MENKTNLTLNQLSREKTGLVKRYDAYKIDPKILVEEKNFNLRNYEDPEVQAHIQNLKEAFKAGAHIPPILVRQSDNGIVLVDGHCRRKAALLAIEEGCQIDYISALDFKGNDADRVSTMLSSAAGLKLKPIEIAEGYKRLNRLNYSNGEIAKAVGVTPARVEQMLILAFANTDVQLMVKNDQVSAEAAIDAVRQFSDNAGAELSKKIEFAQSIGKSKVTKKLMTNSTKIPKKNLGVLVSTLENLLTKNAVKQVKELSLLTEIELASQKIEISGADYLALIEVSMSIQEAKKKEKEKENAKIQKNSEVESE